MTAHPQKQAIFDTLFTGPGLSYLRLGNGNIDTTGNGLMHGMLKYIDRRVARARRAFERLRPDKFKVYVSLGTVFNDKPEVFRMVLRALAAPDYQIIVCAGGMYEALAGNALPPNAALR